MLFLRSILWFWVVFCGMVSASSEHKHLETSSLLTCMDNSQFTASFFDVKFFPHNKTVVFKVDASTIINGNIVVKAELITYGLKVLDKSFNLCDLHEVSLCPLASGRIDVASQYQIDSDVLDEIPGVAYTIPDLDAQVRVVAYAEDDTDLKSPLACVQAILSNGKTVQTKYASWPIAAISGLGLLTSGFVSVIGYSATSAHIASNSISLFIYFQNLAITAMMGVSRVPPMAAAWTQNFQWSMGIISVEFMQKALNWYIQATKGVSTVVVSNKDILSISVQRRALGNLFRRGISLASSKDSNFDSILDDSDLYTTNERNSDNYSTKILVLRGIQRVAFLANIEISNFFLTGAVFFLFFMFCLVIGLIFFKALLELLTRGGMMPETSNFFQYRKNWGSIIKGTLFRLAIIAFPQITLLTIWEYTQRDSPAAVVDAVALFLIITSLLTYGATRVLLKGRESLRLYKNPAYLLYSDTNFLNRYGFLYVQFKADAFWWLLPLLTYGFFRSLFVAVLQTHGKAQAMIIFVIELFYFIALCYYRPYLDKRTNIFNIAIHVVNLINALFFLFFSNLFRQPAVVSSVMAVILFVLNAAFALFLLVFTIITCALALIHRNPDIRYQPMKDDRVSFIPKIDNGGSGYFGGDKKRNSEAELFELKQAVMDTNETEQEKMIRDDTFVRTNNATGNRVLFDDEMSTYTTSSQSNKGGLFNSEETPVEPASAVMGAQGMSNYNNHSNLKVPSQQPSGSNNRRDNNNNNNLRKPETSFYTGNNNHSYFRNDDDASFL